MTGLTGNWGRQRTAAANKSLLIALAVVGVAAAVFWMTRGGGKDHPAEFVPTSPTPLKCLACNKVTVVQPADFVKLKQDTKISTFECPVCHEVRAKVTSMPEDNAPAAEGGGRVAPTKP